MIHLKIEKTNKIIKKKSHENLTNIYENKYCLRSFPKRRKEVHWKKRSKPRKKFKGNCYNCKKLATRLPTIVPQIRIITRTRVIRQALWKIWRMWVEIQRVICRLWCHSTCFLHKRSICKLH